MKTAVIYYSLDGSCALIAERIKTILGADLIRLQTADEKKRTGLVKYIWGGRQVMTGARPQLKPYRIDLNGYDLIILGTPVWAGSPAPALNTFLEEAKITGKRLALFCCHAGGKGRALDKLKAALPGNTIAGTIDFVSPGKNPKAAETLEPWLQTLRG
jgi:flavodoxin